LGDIPRLIVIIDTEEAFDWSRPFSREGTSVSHLGSIRRIQDIFDQYGITPVYVVDYPVATKSGGLKPLRKIHESHRCIIGAHVHPWVTPPFDEPVNRRNSFMMNLTPELQSAKLEILTRSIKENLGTRPTIFKAGRYGIGAGTAALLENQGYEIDVSVCPHMDYSWEGGPDFTSDLPYPYWFGKSSRLLELPLTVGFEGRLRKWGARLYPSLSAPMLKKMHFPGIMARLGLLNRVSLSPEGNSISEQIELFHALYRDGLRVFSFTFHSPSVEPGNTPYVRSQAELSQFLSRFHTFFDFFLRQVGGKPSTPLEIRKEFLASQKTSVEVQ
jgi:hypothetical protein